MYRFSTCFSVKKKLPCNKKHLINTVIEVQKYKQFLPYCHSSNIINQRENYFEAELKVNFKFYDLGYISKVNHEEKKQFYEIQSNCEDGIFNFLRGTWKIQGDLEKQCEFQYDIDFEFKSMLYNQVSGVFLNFVGEQMVDIFTKEAVKRQIIFEKSQKIENKSEIRLEPIIEKHAVKVISFQETHDFMAQQAILKLHEKELIEEKEYIEIMSLYHSEFERKIVKGYDFYILSAHGGETKFLHFIKDILRENNFLKN